MEKFDDTDKKAKPLSTPKTAAFKKSSKNEFNTDGGKTGRKNALNQHNAHEANPLAALINSERKGSRKADHKVDPYMIRQAKLKAKTA